MVLAPASGTTKQEDFAAATAALEKLGFGVEFSPNARQKTGFLAGSDQQRVDDLHTAFERTDIAGIVCLRGGYGSARLLPMLDYERIRRNPKVLMGYSDITALHLGLLSKAGLVSFHGPVATSTFNDFSVSNMRAMLQEAKPAGALPTPTGKETELVTVWPGKASGRLIGGNLSVLVSTVGSPYIPDLRGAILYLEDTGEEPYKVDRMLTQLRLAGLLQMVAGVAFGKFSNAAPSDPQDNGSGPMLDVLRERTSDLKVPVVSGFWIGHITDKWTVPVGIRATLDADSKTLSVDESAVD